LDNTTRVSLGVYYVDTENNPGLIQQGNVIYNPSVKAVESNSNGAKAGLQTGDQILAVNSDKISAKKSLTSLLQNYRPGDQIILRIIRNGVEQDLTVQL